MTLVYQIVCHHPQWAEGQSAALFSVLQSHPPSISAELCQWPLSFYHRVPKSQTHRTRSMISLQPLYTLDAIEFDYFKPHQATTFFCGSDRMS